MENKNDYETLSLDQDDGGYVLTRDAGPAGKTNIKLSEANVVFLGRLAPTVARRIVASKSLAGGDVGAVVGAPMKNISINTDLHGELVLLRIRDNFDAEFDFSVSPEYAKTFGETLIKWADKAISTPKQTKQ